MDNRLNSDNNHLSFLVVDDDQTNRLILETMLRKLGHTVFTACNGQEAIDSYNDNQQDMILMDVMMPVMDGYDACKTIKANNSDLFIPIIFITAITDDLSLSKCIECGGDDFLTKPFNNVILRAKINALTRTSSLYNIINQKNEEMSLIHARLQHEHELAESIFSRISTPPSRDNSSIKYLLSPQSISSGDILMSLDNNGHHYAMLGDFTGHGLSAAIGAIPTTDIFYSLARRNRSISSIAREINNKLFEVLPTGLYCAACIIDIDNTTGVINILNAGIPDALMLMNDDTRFTAFKSTNIPLGIMNADNIDFNIYTVDINNNGRLYIYSDGVTESQNSANKMLGQNGLEDIILSSRGPDSFDNISQRLMDFTNSGQQDDDITICEISLTNAAHEGKFAAFTSSSRWDIDLHFDNENIKYGNPYNTTINLVNKYIDSANIQNSNSLGTIISEIFSNEINHSILQIDSSIKEQDNGFDIYKRELTDKLAAIKDQYIDVSISITQKNMKRTLKLTISSSSNKDYPEIKNFTNNNEKPHGRGIFLLKELCSSLTFDNENRRISLEYTW